MTIDTRFSEITVADYCEMFDQRQVRVNRDYQRSDEVWPRAAQSFLVETILVGMPVPKMFLHQKTDPRTRKTIKEIVDGQQRSRAIYSYAKDEFALTSNVELSEAVGKRFSELPSELQNRFLDYGLSFDLFVGATNEEVREVFRRMNSFTVPLKPEEQRHADYQGQFKWFIRRLGTDLANALESAGTFGQKALVRMQDAKLLTEICSAYFDGISTTNKVSLDRVYKTHDRVKDFPDAERDELDHRVREALAWLLARTELLGTPLMKPNQLYALTLAVMHKQEAIEALLPLFNPADHHYLEDAEAIVNLSRLAEVLEEDDDQAGDFKPFARASSEKTNVKAQRELRFVWYCRALVDDLPA